MYLISHTGRYEACWIKSSQEILILATAAEISAAVPAIAAKDSAAHANDQKASEGFRHITYITQMVKGSYLIIQNQYFV